MTGRNDNITLRDIALPDCETISKAFRLQGWDKPRSQYLTYLEEQQNGSRDVIVALFNEEFAGYLTIKWVSDYAPFQERGIPEITDLNVLQRFQRKGIATRLLQEAEKRISKRSNYAGICFGVTRDYGAAQILYINRNYKPDGNGLVRGSRPLQHGENVRIDDAVVFCLLKEL